MKSVLSAFAAQHFQSPADVHTASNPSITVQLKVVLVLFSDVEMCVRRVIEVSL
jgi:hypothetical protein